jgi:hypothetical protein
MHLAAVLQAVKVMCMVFAMWGVMWCFDTITTETSMLCRLISRTLLLCCRR